MTKSDKYRNKTLKINIGNHDYTFSLMKDRNEWINLLNNDSLGTKKPIDFGWKRIATKTQLDFRAQANVAINGHFILLK